MFGLTETNSYLYEFIFEACEYFTNIGYICDPAEIYAVAGQINEAFDIKKLLKTMLVHNNEEYQIFNEVYKNFVTEYFREHNRQKQIREDFKDKKNKQNEQMKKLGNKQKELEKRIESIKEKSESKNAKLTERETVKHSTSG